MKRVGNEYPHPRVNDGRRKLWLRDDLDQAILPPGLTAVRDLVRGSVTVTLPLPRYLIAKPLAGGKVAFYFNVPTRYRALGCSIPNEPLGADYAVACGPDGKGGRAVTLNALFDEWMSAKSGECHRQSLDIPGISVAVLHKRAIILARGFGVVDIAKGTAATENTPSNRVPHQDVRGCTPPATGRC
jgi:hypothetical protein